VRAHHTLQHLPPHLATFGVNLMAMYKVCRCVNLMFMLAVRHCCGT